MEQNAYRELNCGSIGETNHLLFWGQEKPLSYSQETATGQHVPGPHLGGHSNHFPKGSVNFLSSFFGLT
jgi:hypothetical protein